MIQQEPKWMSKSHLISLISPFDMDFELISATAQLHCSAELCFCWIFRVKRKKLDISVSSHFYFDFLFLPFICPSCPLLSCECHSCCFLLSLCEACLPCSKSAVFPPHLVLPGTHRPLLCEYSSCCLWQCLNCKSTAGVSMLLSDQSKRGCFNRKCEERLHRPEINHTLKNAAENRTFAVLKVFRKAFHAWKC